MRRLRRDVDVRVAFCEQNFPNLRDVLADVAARDAVVVPLLLADAYHARVDIPAMIAESGVRRTAGRRARRGRPARFTSFASASSRPGCPGSIPTWAFWSPRSAHLAPTPMREPRRWPRLPLHDPLDGHHRIRHRPAPEPGRGCASFYASRGATRLVIAPWFLAHGKITDRIAEFARRNGSRWLDRSAPIVWWPRPCSTASTQSSQLAPRRSFPARRLCSYVRLTRRFAYAIARSARSSPSAGSSRLPRPRPSACFGGKQWMPSQMPIPVLIGHCRRARQ